MAVAAEPKHHEATQPQLCSKRRSAPPLRREGGRWQAWEGTRRGKQGSGGGGATRLHDSDDTASSTGLLQRPL